MMWVVAAIKWMTPGVALGREISTPLLRRWILCLERVFLEISSFTPEFPQEFWFIPICVKKSMHSRGRPSITLKPQGHWTALQLTGFVLSSYRSGDSCSTNIWWVFIMCQAHIHFRYFRHEDEFGSVPALKKLTRSRVGEMRVCVN